MAMRNCPNCGNPVPKAAVMCTCGFTFVQGEIDVPPPGIVRSTVPAKAGGAASPILAQSGEASHEARPGKRMSDIPVRPARAAVRPVGAILMSCPSCGSRISKRAHQCPKCGAAPYDTCHVCGTGILSNSAPCPECGDPFPFDPELG